MNDKIFYISGQLFYLLSLFILNTLTARTLGPEQMGIWNLVNLVAEYGFIVTLGSINGMAREVPVSIGKENFREAETVTGNALLFNSAVIAILFIAAAWIYSTQAGTNLYLAIGICLLISRIMNSFSYILIRSWQQFYLLGAQQSVMGVIQFCCLSVLIWHKSLSAVFIITVVPLLAGSAFSFKYLSNIRSQLFDYLSLKKIVATGFPIYMTSLLYSLFATTDRLLITSFLGVRSLGLYTPAIIAVSIISLAPTFVANIMYPKLAEMFGRTDSCRSMKPYLNRMISVNVVTTLLLAVLIFLAFKLVFIPYFLPEYAVALYPTGIMLLGAIVSSVGHGYGDFFNAIGRQRIYLINVTFGLAVNVIAGYLFLSFTRLGIIGVTIGTFLAVAVYSALQVVSAHKVLNEQ